MKTLLLLIIGAVVGIWLYNSHPALIPDNLTKSVDASVDWIQDLWPDDQSRTETSESKQNQRRQGTPEVDEPTPQAGQNLSTSEPEPDNTVSPRPNTGTTETQTPRKEAMSTYSRVIRMIDSAK